jgi:hypothetical protein
VTTSKVMVITLYGESPAPLNCPFDADFGTTCDDGSVEVEGGYDPLLVFTQSEGADSVYTAVKTFADQFNEYRFGSDFGEVYYYCSECGFGWGLRAVRIGGWNGQVYGELLVPPKPVSSGAPPAHEHRIAIDAWPNPFRGQLRVAFVLPEPRAVGLEVVDVLGRVVKRRPLGTLAPGEHEVSLQTSALTAGTYLLRIRGGGIILNSRMVTRTH